MKIKQRVLTRGSFCSVESIEPSITNNEIVTRVAGMADVVDEKSNLSCRFLLLIRFHKSLLLDFRGGRR